MTARNRYEKLLGLASVLLLLTSFFSVQYFTMVRPVWAVSTHADIYLQRTDAANLIVTVGVGNDTNNPLWSQTNNYGSVGQPTLTLTFDLTGQEAYLPPSNARPWFVTVYDSHYYEVNESTACVRIVWFNITYLGTTYPSKDVLPKNVVGAPALEKTIVYNPLPPVPNKLRFKWATPLGELGRTYIAPLAADLFHDGKMEIVVTGGNDDTGTYGAVTVLNGTDGSIIWQDTVSALRLATSSTNINIGDYSPFEIADLNNDGLPEIIIAAKSTLVLHGNDGSIYWLNEKAPADSNYPAVADIDGNGYPTVFVSSGLGPTLGSDNITSLSYNGVILHKAFSWHPCWGGLSIANINGRFILFQGDRSNSYSAPGDAYTGGGLGVRALDAHTLTPLWNDPKILASSHDPVLADVHNDGVLDVIALDEGSPTGPGGIVVLNATDGSPVTTGGVYRYGTPSTPVHSQPTVYDIDGDGHLEIIVCDKSNPQIWDLYTWTLKATLNIVSWEPPKVGHVTADGKMDIIAVASNYTATGIYEYIGGTYRLVDQIKPHAAVPFSLVQDLDNDGYNELVFSSEDGVVYCYDTPGPTPSPKPKSGLQFYSERRLGAAEYVPDNVTQSWNLTVVSAHGSPSPGVGPHTYNGSFSVTCSVTSPVTEGSTVWTCTGWSGTGSVPSSGSSTSVTFTITQNSSITWNWANVTKNDTQVAFTFSPNPANYGVTVVLSGNLTDKSSGSPVYPAQVVVIYSMDGGVTWVPYVNLNTNSTGGFSQIIAPPPVGTYLVNVSYAGSSVYNPSNQTVTLTVNQTGPPPKSDTQVAFTFSPNPAKLGDIVLLSGTLTNKSSGNPVISAQVVVIYSMDGGVTWVPYVNLNTNSTGGFSQIIAPPPVGTYLVNVSYAGSSVYNPSNQSVILIVSA